MKAKGAISLNCGGGAKFLEEQRSPKKDKTKKVHTKTHNKLSKIKKILKAAREK